MGQEADKPKSATKRLLIVDDNRDTAESLSMLLELMGHEVRTAHDGLAAIDVAAEFHPDAVLLDIGLPKLNGYDTARRIREQAWGKAMHLIAVTGWGQDTDRTEARTAGFDHHLTKPVDIPTLTKLLTNGREKP
jgi:DNA-binding response OmpR family regulator